MRKEIQEKKDLQKGGKKQMGLGAGGGGGINQMVNAPRSSKIGLRRSDEGAAAGKKNSKIWTPNATN
jgi:hypothetical protein